MNRQFTFTLDVSGVLCTTIGGLVTARTFFDGLSETLMPTKLRVADSDACTCQEIMNREDCTQLEAIELCSALMHRCHDCDTDVDPIERTHQHVY